MCGGWVDSVAGDLVDAVSMPFQMADNTFDAIGDLATGNWDNLGDDFTDMAHSLANPINEITQDVPGIGAAASIIFPPAAPFIMGAQALANLENKNYLGAGMSALGAGAAGLSALGSAGNAADSAFGGLADSGDAIGSFDGLSSAGTGATDFGSSLSAGGDLASSGSAIPSFDNLSEVGSNTTSGFGDIGDTGGFNVGSGATDYGVPDIVNTANTAEQAAPNTMSFEDFMGDQGQVAGQSAQNLGTNMDYNYTDADQDFGGLANSGYALPSTSGMTQTDGSLWDRLFSGNTQTPLQQGVGTLGGLAKAYQAFNNAGNMSNQANMMRALYNQQYAAGLQDYNNQLAQKSAYQNQLNTLNNLYTPNSPYAQQMQANTLRQDAARGRISNYAARNQGLAANLTQQQANLMNSPQYIQMLGAANANPVAPTNYAQYVSNPSSIPQYLQGIQGLGQAAPGIFSGLSSLASLF